MMAIWQWRELTVFKVKVPSIPRFSSVLLNVTVYVLRSGAPWKPMPLPAQLPVSPLPLVSTVTEVAATGNEMPEPAPVLAKM